MTQDPFSRVGQPAERDDIAPEGTIITRQHVIDYMNRVNEVNARFGVVAFPNVPAN